MRLVVRTILMSDMEFFTIVRPVEYESDTDFLCDLETVAKKSWTGDGSSDIFTFAGHSWDVRELGNFDDDGDEWTWYFGQVEVMTLDEWFAKYGGSR